MPPCDLSCELVQVARSCVVAQPFPCFHDGLGSRTRQCFEARESLQKSRVIVQHPADLGLLEHELRDEDGIGIARLAPRKYACVSLVPGSQLAREAHSHTRYRPMRAFTAALDLRRYVGRWSLRSASQAGRFSFMILDLGRGVLARWGAGRV